MAVSTFVDGRQEKLVKKIIALAFAAATLGGCAVYPAPYYGPRVVVAAPAPYYAPRPYYYHW
jgi:hypothetical protein